MAGRIKDNSGIIQGDFIPPTSVLISLIWIILNRYYAISTSVYDLTSLDTMFQRAGAMADSSPGPLQMKFPGQQNLEHAPSAGARRAGQSYWGETIPQIGGTFNYMIYIILYTLYQSLHQCFQTWQL